MKIYFFFSVMDLLYIYKVVSIILTLINYWDMYIWCVCVCVCTHVHALEIKLRTSCMLSLFTTALHHQPPYWNFNMTF